ncbi:MAG: hypothetical protein ABSD77_05730 [Verrucomicrobiota bacterium]
MVEVIEVDTAHGDGAERVGFGNPFARGDFVVKVAQPAALNEEIHKK